MRKRYRVDCEEPNCDDLVATPGPGRMASRWCPYHHKGRIDLRTHDDKPYPYRPAVVFSAHDDEGGIIRLME